MGDIVLKPEGLVIRSVPDYQDEVQSRLVKLHERAGVPEMTSAQITVARLAVDMTFQVINERNLARERGEE